MLLNCGVGEDSWDSKEIVEWHPWFNGHEFEPTVGDSEGQRILVCCSPWDCKDLDMTEQLNNNVSNVLIIPGFVTAGNKKNGYYRIPTFWLYVSASKWQNLTRIHLAMDFGKCHFQATSPSDSRDNTEVWMCRRWVSMKSS